MDVHDIAGRASSERVRRWLTVTFQVTADPAPQWLRPGQTAAAALLFVGFAGLLLAPVPLVLWFVVITLGALGSLILRLLSLRWAPSLIAGPWPQAPGTGSLSVTVTGRGPTPLRAIKAVRDLTGVPLRAARDAVMDAPTTLLVDVGEAEATRAADVLRAAGAQITVTAGGSPAELPGA
jgi:hypothetical protein